MPISKIQDTGIRFKRIREEDMSAVRGLVCTILYDFLFFSYLFSDTKLSILKLYVFSGRGGMVYKKYHTNRKPTRTNLISNQFSW